MMRQVTQLSAGHQAQESFGMKKAGVVFVGPVPPPVMGPSLATEIILKSDLSNRFNLIHLDTSHHSDLSTLGKVGVGNILSALKHYLKLLVLLACNRVNIVYIPISQTTIGYLRDSGFILLAKLFGKKVVCHLRGGNFRRWLEGASPWVRRYVKFIHRKVDIQIVLGEKLRRLFEGITPDNRIYVVPNGRNFDWGQTDGSTAGKSAKTRILFLSNLAETKGVLDVLRSVPRVLESCKDVEFIFAGAWCDETAQKEFTSVIKNHKEYPITVVGKVLGADKLALLRSAEIFVFPTFYPPEGHPWAIVEAMAAGLPVISTDQGAITESVVDGVNGYIVNKHDPRDVAEKLVTLCADQELAKRMGRESRALYNREFTEERMVERMTAAFKAALSVST